MKNNQKLHWRADRISRLFLYVATAVIALVFLLYYCVGYDVPAMWDEKYNSPALTDLVIILMFLLLFGACVAVVSSAVRTIRKIHSPAVVNGINGRLITWSVAGAVAALMAFSFFILPADRMLANGRVFDEEIWIRMTNMFVTSSTLLIFIGILSILFGIIKNYRRK